MWAVRIFYQHIFFSRTNKQKKEKSKLQNDTDNFAAIIENSSLCHITVLQHYNI